MGYAEILVRMMDPTGALFSSRIVSRDDLPAEWKPGRQIYKSLERIFPFSDSFALILDDSPDVWRSNMSNLLQVTPYIYFAKMSDVNVFDNTSDKDPKVGGVE